MSTKSAPPNNFFELLCKAERIIHSAYSTAEWLQHSRTEETDNTWDAIKSVISEETALKGV